MARNIAAIIAIALVVAGCTGTAEPSSAPTTATPTPVPAPSATPPPSPTPEPTLTASPAPTATPTPSPTETPVGSWPNGFELGAYAEDVESGAALMLSSGIGWVAQQAWFLEGDTVGVGNLISVAHDRGLKVLLNVTGDWELAYDDEYQAGYVRALADLAAKGADGIEVWDEPNTLGAMAVVDPVEYAELLCAAYEAIKGSNPDTVVISAAPAPSGSADECTEEACGDLLWLQALAEAGAFECADMVGARHTTGATAPDTTVGHPSGLDHHSFYFLPTVRRYYAAAGGVLPLAFTQFGYLSPEGYDDLPPAFWWATITSAADQADWTARALQLASASDRVGMVVIWNLDATDWGGDHSSVRAGYALVRPDGTCPTCKALGEAFRQP